MCVLEWGPLVCFWVSSSWQEGAEVFRCVCFKLRWGEISNMCRFIQAPVSLFWLNPSVLCCCQISLFCLWEKRADTAETRLTKSFPSVSGQLQRLPHFFGAPKRGRTCPRTLPESLTPNVVSIWTFMHRFRQCWKQQHCAPSGQSILKHTNVGRGRTHRLYECHVVAVNKHIRKL